MSNVLQPLLTGVSPFVIVIILTVAALIMTNFFSNVVTMTLFFNIGVALLGNSSVNMGMFAMVIGIAAAMACLTPAACAPMPLVFGPGHVTMGNTIKANIMFIVFALVVLLGFVVPFAPMVIGG